jgi:hypothetical protein
VAAIDLLVIAKHARLIEGMRATEPCKQVYTIAV